MDENFRTMEMLQGSRSEKFIESGIRRNIFTFLAQQLSEILHLTGNDGLKITTRNGLSQQTCNRSARQIYDINTDKGAGKFINLTYQLMMSKPV